MSDQTLRPAQRLEEDWTVDYERPGFGRPIVARLRWPHNTVYCVRGEGQTVEEARLALVLALAAAIADDRMSEPPVPPDAVRRLQNAARRGLRSVA